MQYNVPAATRIGHVHLKVSDLERALGFYRDLLGFEVTQLYGTQAAFVSAGGYHHHIGLNTWYGKGRTVETTALAATLSLWTDLRPAFDAVYTGLQSGSAAVAKP